MLIGRNGSDRFCADQPVADLGEPSEGRLFLLIAMFLLKPSSYWPGIDIFFF